MGKLLSQIFLETAQNTQISKPGHGIKCISIKKVSSQESNTEEDYRSGGLTPIPILLKLVFALSIFKSQYQKDKFDSRYNSLTFSQLNSK